ncbi:MAG: glycosyltransferase family 2 protein [Phycisphaerales bacterium]
MARTHVILVTHTPQRLRRTILGVAWSGLRPDTFTLSCDSDDPEIERVARAACDEGAIGMTLVQRANTGKGRPAQARNNAVRALVERHDPDDADALVFFDGDCVPDHHAIERHAAAIRPRRIVLGWRYDLSPDQDAAFDEGKLRAGALPFDPDASQTASIAARQKRYRKQVFWKRFGIGKEHKPKVLGANFGLTLGDYRRINGHDETFESWAQEDDDFGRRLYRAGVRPVLRLTDILAYHQHHVTRAPDDWKASANAGRLEQPCETICRRGLTDPADQPPVRVAELPGRAPTLFRSEGRTNAAQTCANRA